MPDKITFHPLANLFPLLAPTEIETLARDIAENGLTYPITLFEGKILDGRNRFTACTLANIEPQFINYEGDDPVKFVVSTNLHRRHLNESQRAMVAAKLANRRQGHPENKPANLLILQGEAANLLNTSERSLRSAKKVQSAAVPEIVEAVESGKLAVSVAANPHRGNAGETAGSHCQRR